jgi:outer membrane lipase/esterase
MYYIKFYIVLIFILIDYAQTHVRIFPFNTIVTFGDGNTDTGNVYNLTNHQWPLVPPYYQGRFTNGPIWVEKLNIPNIIDYAYGGATIDNNNLIPGSIGPNGTLVPGIRQQIVDYFVAYDIDTTDLSQTLYVIWAGGNEYFLDSSLSADIVVHALINAVNDLLVIGIQHLIVMNLPPLQSFPGNDQDYRLNTLVTEHNNYLLSNINKIRAEYPKISVQIFDLYSLIANILANNSIYTLNKIDKCWDIVNYTILSQCTNPNQYVFIDNYYFTSVVHQIIANNIHQFILSSSSRTFSFPKFCTFICIILCIIKKYE